MGLVGRWGLRWLRAATPILVSRVKPPRSRPATHCVSVTRLYTRLYTCLYTCPHTCPHTRLCTCPSTYFDLGKHTCACVHTCACARAWRGIRAVDADGVDMQQAGLINIEPEEPCQKALCPVNMEPEEPWQKALCPVNMEPEEPWQKSLWSVTVALS